MMVLLGENAIVCAYVGSLTGDTYSDCIRSIGIISDEGRLVGGIVFTNYTGAGVEMSLAGRRSITPTAMQAIGDVAFGDLGCMRLSVTTRKSNKRVCKIAPRAGFKFEGIARRFYGDEDGVVLSLLRDEAIQKGYWRANVSA